MKINNMIYVGAMTGTSHDAIDVSFVEISDKVSLKFFYSQRIPASINLKIKKLIESNTTSLSDLGVLDKEIGNLFAMTIKRAIQLSKIKVSDIASIAISGQTIRHESLNKNSFSMQIGDPNISAALISSPVISDFRNMHIAMGGMGAPLVPEFHQEIFYKSRDPRIVLNIGGIANYSYIKNKNDLWGSDVGPGNALMDAYCKEYLYKPFDKNGDLASKGSVIQSELKKLIGHKFFKASFPKSTGKEIFNLNILSRNLIKKSPNDVLATLAEFTAQSIVLGIKKNKHKTKKIIICGGGAKNKYLISRISSLSDCEVILSNVYGYDIQAIESMAFAWLGYKRINNNLVKIQLGKNKFSKGLLGSITKSKP